MLSSVELHHSMPQFEQGYFCPEQIRSSRVKQGSKEFFQIYEWQCQEDESIEQVKYYSPRPERKINEIEYEGWRRYIEERQDEEGIRIILHVRDLKVQAALVRAIEIDDFKKIGWMEPIRVTREDPIVVINYRENAIRTNAGFMNQLFQRIGQIEALPDEILYDLKYFIANNCVHRFLKKMDEIGF